MPTDPQERLDPDLSSGIALRSQREVRRRGRQKYPYESCPRRQIHSSLLRIQSGYPLSIVRQAVDGADLPAIGFDGFNPTAPVT
jgi:hypothetical protein